MGRSGAFWGPTPKAFIRTITADTNKLAISLAERIFDAAVSLSPVYSGSYRASWNISIDSLQTVYNDYHGQRIVGQPAARQPLSDKFQKLYVSNGSPYAVLIEYGWSQQAPMGVLSQAMKSV